MSCYVETGDFNALYPVSDSDEPMRPGWHRLSRCMIHVTEPAVCTITEAERYMTDTYSSIGTVLRVQVHEGAVSKVALLFSETDDELAVEDDPLGVVSVDGRDAFLCADYTIGESFVVVDVNPARRDYRLGIVRTSRARNCTADRYRE